MSKSAPLQHDPTQRFQKFDEYTSARTCVMRFKGYDTFTGIEVTWHEIDISTLNESQKSNLLEYSKTLKTLKFESLLSLIHYWVDDEKHIFYLITESMICTSILEHILIDNTIVNERVLARWFHSVLLALDFLHSRPNPIVHSRVSLSSIYVKPSSGHVKLVPPLIEPLYLYQGLNTIKLRLSSPPEFLMRSVVPASDIWAFGISLLHAATLIQPYSECKSPNVLIAKLQNCELPECIAKVESPLIIDLVKKCLTTAEKRPTARDLMGHKFFQREFEPIPENISQDEGIEVIFTGKPTTSHNEIPTVS